MELITSTNTGISYVSESFKITYNLPSVEFGTSFLTGTIYKNDILIGSFNASRNGIIGFSLAENNNLVANEIKSIMSQAIDDTFYFFANNLK